MGLSVSFSAISGTSSAIFVWQVLAENLEIVRQPILQEHKLKEGELRVRQQMLRQLLEGMELGRDAARLHYHFPMTYLHFMPPTGFEPVSPP